MVPLPSLLRPRQRIRQVKPYFSSSSAPLHQATHQSFKGQSDTILITCLLFPATCCFHWGGRTGSAIKNVAHLQPVRSYLCTDFDSFPMSTSAQWWLDPRPAVEGQTLRLDVQYVHVKHEKLKKKSSSRAEPYVIHTEWMIWTVDIEQRETESEEDA